MARADTPNDAELAAALAEKEKKENKPVDPVPSGLRTEYLALPPSGAPRCAVNTQKGAV